MSKEKKKESWLIKTAKKWLLKNAANLAHDNHHPEMGSNPFLERTIENWLSSVNEKSYQLPFCQLLLSEGYKVLHSSKHSTLEQGKDVIAIDKKGIPCVFQLKGGNITNSRWRNELKGEIEELIDYPIIHPSVNKNKKHRSCLITNGELEDNVRLGIEALNSDKWKDSPLHIITHGELLNKFVRVSGNFIPQKVSDYKSFLDLYFSDGKELTDEKQYTDFIKDVLRLNEEGLSKEERKRNIAAAILYTSYIISKFKKENNHISIVQTLILLCAYIFALVEKYGLNDRYWIDSFMIVWAEVMHICELLQKEIAQDKLSKITVTSMWDGEIGPFREYLASSYIFAYKIAQLIEENPEWKDIATGEFFKQIKGSLQIWGEASLFPFILIFLYANKAPAISGEAEKIFKILSTPLEAIIACNGRKGRIGLLSPYYSIATAINMALDLLEEPMDETFAHKSFMVKPLIDIFVRYEKRKELEGYWREITYIEQEEFVPDELWQHFLWRCDKGENKLAYPDRTQSWKKLADSANKIDSNLIPRTIRKHPYFLPFFLLIYPHRINSNYIKFLDETVKRTKLDN